MDLSKVHSLAGSRSLGTSRRDGSVGSLSMRVPSQDVYLVEEVLGDVDDSEIADDLDAENESSEINEKLASSSLQTDVIFHSSEKNQIEINSSSSDKQMKDKLPGRLDYISYMVHFAVFGILGVFTRYLLQKLFVDLLSNILGSFLMGWFGVIFKADIRNVSDDLVIGLTTGYLGSLTTFSGWNMKMLDLSVRGPWVFTVGGIVLGMAITAVAFRRSLLNWHHKSCQKTKIMLENLRVNTHECRIYVLLSMILIFGAIWIISCVLAKRKLDSVSDGAVPWLGLNGRGIGRRRNLKWLPIITLTAYILAACVMAVLATISKEVNTKICGIIVSSIQFGFLGCLSTVSSFVAEILAIRQSGHIFFFCQDERLGR
ncbi:putative fluoride ion transporter CrcB protein [Dioscorea alata]|uniref:Fluoride ion transporter CrcB protein n=1 Tax=Dioscorea alata TaxID=55571 RepID=A0ACB7UPX0_DIOAL|nr:putative fluoride ion transporter CrcB protein [Dioscorea alata]